MSAPATHTSPTARQLRYLRALASKTATTFTPPTTRRQASREIDRLRGLRKNTTLRVEGASPAQEEVAYATALQPDEVAGFGGAVGWRRHVPDTRSSRPGVALGKRTELARYSVGGEERVLYGQRINGSVRITDRSASGEGRSYVVERECEHDGYGALKALVADYLDQSRELGSVPMASSALRLESQQGAAHD